MAEASDQESKTLEPTEKKIRDSLDQGKIPVSREASIFASMAALMVIQTFLIGPGVQQLTPTLKSFLDDPGGFRLSTGADAQNLLTVVALQAMHFMLPLVIILIVFGLAASLLQNSPRPVLAPLPPRLLASPPRERREPPLRRPGAHRIRKGALQAGLGEPDRRLRVAIVR